MHDDVLAIAPDVAAALAEGRAVVALESTIITHGMPYPDNVGTARTIEGLIRERGATPATIAIMDGRIRIGLSPEELDRLGAARDVLKLSRADLAYALTSRRVGATTVAATMICAALAGIPVFATGGIGGVHRGAEQTDDVSADLTELARTPVTVVSAGAKAILDLPRTFERLETLGVPVVGYGVDELPAFWSRGSGLKAPIRLDAPAEIAAMIRMRQRLGLGGGVLVANPIPVEAEIPAGRIGGFIETALADAARQGVGAKEVTPFLLARMLELTGGDSLRANIALVRSNAAVAADIARALAGSR